MLVRRIVLMVALAAAVSAVTPARAVAQPIAGSAAAALHEWVDAFNSRDANRIVAFYAPDAMFWGTTATTIAGTPEAIAAYFKAGVSRPLTRVTLDRYHERIYGDIAIISGAYTFADVRDGVASNIRPARFTFVFRRDGERWLIVDHHSSRVPES